MHYLVNYQTLIMIKKLFAVFILIPSLILSCTKEKVQQNFSPVGFWRGNAYLFHTAVLNKPDGSARIYFRITGIDTANAIKADGFYSVSGNSFKVTGVNKRNDPNYDIRDTLFIEANLTSPSLMNGQLYSTFSPEIVDCTLRKQ